MLKDGKNEEVVQRSHLMSQTQLSTISQAEALFTGSKITDDFNWKLYHEHYKGELSEIAKIHTQILSPNDYIYKNNKLIINNEILPLHPNHKLLYETIMQLSPSSLMELGCGGGDHLWNISVLSPTINLFGRDISTEQIKFLKKRHPNLVADIDQLDVTLPHPFNSPKVDIVFAQAVIMHIQTGNAHLVALSNLFRYATKQVILMENWNKHNFKNDIEFLFSNYMLPWENIYMYYSNLEELKRPHILIISSEPLTDYKKLTDYSMLLKGK